MPSESQSTRNQYLVVKKQPHGYPDESWGPISASDAREAAEEAQEAANADYTQHADINVYPVGGSDAETFAGDEI